MCRSMTLIRDNRLNWRNYCHTAFHPSFSALGLVLTFLSSELHEFEDRVDVFNHYNIVWNTTEGSLVCIECQCR